MDQSKGGPPTGENDIQLTQEDAVRIGGELKRLIRTESFETCVEIMKEEMNHMVFSSDPSQREIREQTYHRYRALEDLIATMNTFVAIYEENVFGGDEDN